MTNAPEYSCTCGARFYTLGAYKMHELVVPRKCLKADRLVTTPEQYAETPTEHAQQVALFMWAAMPETLKLYPALEYMFAIPNGGLRDRVTAMRLKAEGVKSGVPDVMLPVTVRWREGTIIRAGLFIEMKRPKTQDQREGQVSSAQSELGAHLIKSGYIAIVCYSFQEARDAIIKYLS